MEKPGTTRRGKLLIIVGARPQFIKAAAMSWAIQAWNSQPDRPGFEEIIIHTGQHYDYDLSQSFFDELAIPNPHFNLNVKSASHAIQTAKMISNNLVYFFRNVAVMLSQPRLNMGNGDLQFGR